MNVSPTMKDNMLRWGWIDSNGYVLQWFDNQRIERERKPKFNVQGARSGRIQTSKPNFTDKDRNEKRYDRKDNQRLSTGDRRPSSQPVRPPYRGSRPVGTGS